MGKPSFSFSSRTFFQGKLVALVDGVLFLVHGGALKIPPDEGGHLRLEHGLKHFAVSPLADQMHDLIDFDASFTPFTAILGHPNVPGDLSYDFGLPLDFFSSVC